MNGLSAVVRTDMRLQHRSRLYLIGLFTAAALGLVARALFGGAPAGPVLSALYLLGVGSTTYVFGAALVLMERSQGTLVALRATPMGTRAYVGSKVLTLTSFALVESAVIYFVGFAGQTIQPLPVVLGVSCLGVVYTLVGMGQVASHDSVTSFLMPGALIVGSLLQLPFLYILGVGPEAIWYAAPTQGITLLMLAGFQELEAWQWAYAIGSTAVVLMLSSWWVSERFRAHIGFGGDLG